MRQFLSAFATALSNWFNLMNSVIIWQYGSTTVTAFNIWFAVTLISLVLGMLYIVPKRDDFWK